ncbi:helix-turn-helix transcriptional regulator [Devosia geojensis]|uniref:helix-turn-helix transcriptional regulator n=1 Tax=Devosia geojensis TaxID=443610 RepID=UPI000A775593|nr:AraC family transcriptional regulator [Devosia geojensis]
MPIDPAIETRLRVAVGHDLLGGIPQHVGPRLSTLKGGVVHSLRPPGTMTFQSPGDFVAIVLARVPRMESRLGSDTLHVFDAPVGMLIVSPANVDSASRWFSLRENLTVGYEPGFLAELAAREFSLLDLRLHPLPFGHVDTQALQIAHLFKQELASGAANELYIDSLMTVLGLHVVRYYSNATEARAGVKAGESGLSQTSARRVQDFLKENFAGKVSVASLAELCGLSPGHFIQAFTRSFGVPPYRYLINLRLGYAAQLLSETQLPIAEVAYLSGFSSQSHLTSTMRKYRNFTPAQIRSGGRV